MGAIEYHKCIVYRRGWCNRQLSPRRLEYAEVMARDTTKIAFKMWKNILKKTLEKFRHYTWAAVGYNFRSDLTFYTVPDNTNGKMSKKVYRDVILEPVVGPWCDQVKRGWKDPFVLEEDGDSGHGTDAQSCIVRKWKDKKGLKTYRNCTSSPDLAPIENCWQPPKQYLKKFPH